MLWLSHAEREHELWSELWTFGMNALGVRDRRADEPVLGARPTSGHPSCAPKHTPVFAAAARKHGPSRSLQ